jgi:hypothetical protein
MKRRRIEERKFDLVILTSQFIRFYLNDSIVRSRFRKKMSVNEY